MKITITGSQGNIGMAVCAFLKLKGIPFIGIDLKNGNDVRNDFPKSDVLVHLAANLAGSCVYEHNIDATRAILDKAPKVIFASTSLVYGENKMAKETDKLNPVDDYAKSKVECEGIIKDSTMNYSILRFSNIYGANMDHGIVYDLFETREIRGDGSKVRDYIFSFDVVKVIIEAIFTDKWNGVYNISTGVGTSTLELFTRLFPDETPKFIPDKGNSPKICVADNSKAKKNGFNPFIL